MSDQTMLEKATRAFYDALDKQGNYVGDYQFEDGVRTTLDGTFDLTAAMRAAIETIREPTKAMVEAGRDALVNQMDHGSNAVSSAAADAVWPAMVDEILAQPVRRPRESKN